MHTVESTSNARQRASTPRSRTGCITCKVRRLKCGEEKPGCFRCAKSGWKCDGYEHLKSKSGARTRTPSPGSYLYTTSSLNLNESERRYFQSYIDFSPLSLDDGEASNFALIKEIMLQESHGNSCVRHAIVAIGALEKSFHTKFRWGYLRHLSSSQGANHEFALSQYGKALQGLPTSIDELERRMDARQTLVSAIALSIFDFFCGNTGFANQNIHLGRKILAAYRPPRSVSSHGYSPSPQGGTIEQSLIRTFANLDIQTLFATGLDSPCNYTSLFSPSTSIQSILIPLSFTCPEASRNTRTVLLSVGQDLILQSLSYHFVSPSVIPSHYFQQRQALIEKIHTWLHAYEPLTRGFIETSMHPMTRSYAFRLPIVQLLIRISGIFQESESVYDGLTTHFEYLLNISRDVISFEQATQPVQINPDFNYATEFYAHEPRILPALHLVATKCRVAFIRNEALSHLFATHRREGNWDSILCAKVAQALIALESESLEMAWDWTSEKSWETQSRGSWDHLMNESSNHFFPNQGSTYCSQLPSSSEFGAVSRRRQSGPFFGVIESHQSSPYLGNTGLNLGVDINGLQDFDQMSEGRCWGETVVRYLHNPRQATLRCRQNRSQDMGGGWIERTVVIEWD
ncbi:hypothetical protein BJ878DRAFT_496918 [Calycina marina]|uniref:Zn(2)-C6 fungal-type domain-containing protein n=1 Tax=Calycina marina TaxID=1763456 RepID=A0A9P7Z718_9HELO|nr:hypothetical protein BJ878DRAFT_496918 [Calycina marina]